MMWMPDCATFFISSAPRTCCHFSEWQDTPYPASSDFIKIKKLSAKILEASPVCDGKSLDFKKCDRAFLAYFMQEHS